MEAYEDALNHTSTSWAPWHVIPANRKWFAHLAVADVLLLALQQLDLHYPTVSDEHRRALEHAREILENKA